MDIALTQEDAPGLTARPVTSSTAHIRIEKTLDQDGWQTRVTLLHALRTASDSATITSVVVDARGSIVGVYDAYGNPVSIPKRSRSPATVAVEPTLIETLARQVGSRSSTGLTSPGPTSSSFSTLSTTKTTDLRNWIDQFVVTPRAKARTVARLTRLYGAPVDTSPVQDRYRLTRGGAPLEEMFDRSIGAVVSQAFTNQRGQPIRVTKKFVPGAGGRYLLRQMVTEYPAQENRTARLVQEFTNLHIEAR